MKKATKETPAFQFLQLAWDNSSKGVPFSYERLNHTMAAAMRVALGAFQFAPEDFSKASSQFRGEYWLYAERCYSSAVANGNTSACVAIEKHLGREPLIADDVKMGGYSTYDSNTHLIGDRQKERLHIGCSFPWKGEIVKVTSFKGNAAIACSYQQVGETKNCPACRHMTEWPKEKILHRFTITREDIIAERAERKRRQIIHDALMAIESETDAIMAALAKIGIKTRQDFDRAPLKKLEKVLAKFKPAE